MLLSDDDRRLSKLKDQNERLTQILVGKEDELDELRLDHADLKEALERVRREKKSLDGMLSSAKKKLREFREASVSHSFASEEKRTLTKQCERLAQESAATRREVDSIRTVLQEPDRNLVEAVRSLQADNERQREELLVRVREIASLNQAKDEAEKKLLDAVGRASEEQPSSTARASVPSLSETQVNTMRLEQELERLKEHLLNVSQEQSEKEELLLCREREVEELRSRLTNADHRMLASDERAEEAMRRCKQLESELSLVRESEQNLQAVLEQTEDVNQSEIAESVRQVQFQLSQEQEKRRIVEEQCVSMQSAVQELAETRRELERLREEALQREMHEHSLKYAAEQSTKRLQTVHAQRELMVDRTLVKRLILELFATHERKLLAMKTLADLLSFSQKEMDAVGMGESSSLLSTVVSLVAPLEPEDEVALEDSSSPAGSDVSRDQSPSPWSFASNLIDLYVQFLEKSSD